MGGNKKTPSLGAADTADRAGRTPAQLHEGPHHRGEPLAGKGGEVARGQRPLGEASQQLWVWSQGQGGPGGGGPLGESGLDVLRVRIRKLIKSNN